MSFLNSVLKIFVGDKSKQDVKKITPIVKSITSLDENISILSNDELRGKTQAFKDTIKEAIDPSKNKIEVELDLDNIPSKFKIKNTNFIKNENLSENG